jgi:UDP-glucose 4-epimerase
VVQDPARLRPDASEVLALLSDPALALETLGWTAATGLEDGIGATIEWIRAQAAPSRDAARVQL